MLQAVKQNGGALAYADPALQEDRGADGVAEVVAASEGNLAGNCTALQPRITFVNLYKS